MMNEIYIVIAAVVLSLELYRVGAYNALLDVLTLRPRRQYRIKNATFYRREQR